MEKKRDQSSSGSLAELPPLLAYADRVSTNSKTEDSGSEFRSLSRAVSPVLSNNGPLAELHSHETQLHPSGSDARSMSKKS